MNRIVYSLFAAALVAVSGCQDETVENPVTPAQTGDEITFGSSLLDVQTRTIYGDEAVNGAYPVYWENGDQIAIYCPQAAQGNLVTYKVTPDETNAAHSSAVTKVNTDQAGLQWGKEETHKFSAFYPADKIEGMEDGKLKGIIPLDQNPKEWKRTENEAGGITYTGVANTDYAFMWAYNEHDKSDGSDVSLVFKPWVTILDVEINGPADDGEEIKMSAVQLRSQNYETLNGEFLIDFTSVEQNPESPDAAPTYIQSGNPNSTRSQITIQFYDQSLNNGQGDFITLKKNDKIVVRFYLLPKDGGYDTSTGRQDLQLRVTPYNSAVLVRTLNAEGGQQVGGILPHKVNKVILPPVNQTGPNYWMSSLNPNIYISELSLPGSKMSASTTGNSANVVYQNLDISEQFKNGIRGFLFQTCGINDGGLGIFEEPDMNLYLAINGIKKNTKVIKCIEDIANGLRAAEEAGKNQEYAFVLLAFSEGPSEGHGSTNNYRAWMEAIEEELKDMTATTANQEKYRIFEGEITPQTKISDVAGKIIVKVNYNEDYQAEHVSASARIPALFTQWKVPYVENGVDMRWGSPNPSVTPKLKWLYQEVTAVGDGGEATLEQKKQYIEALFTKSVDFYKNNNDNSMWFMNDLGGSMTGMGNGDKETSEGVLELTKILGPYATQILQKRPEDASLGIVYMNFADPKNQYSGNLIQTIINNNFSFQLRTDGSQQAETYNATYSNGGNAIGWDK